jgi:hypothetical protein
LGGDRWEGGKKNKGYKSVSDASFQEAKGHKHNFVSLSGFVMKLDLGLISELCQTVGD